MRMKDVGHLKTRGRCIMSVKSMLLIILHFTLLKYTYQSITGVTYMDHFDFEDRYRDVYECDPFYWHPLHLPEHCAEILTNALRSKIASTIPLRILKRKDHFMVSYEDMSREDTSLSHEREPTSYEFPLKVMSPYEKMLEYLRRDVAKDPKAPIMGLLPNIGPVAVYRQPVSRRSKNMIKKIARDYAKSRQNGFEDTESYYGYINVKDPTKNDNSDEIDTRKSQNAKQSDKILRLTKKTKNGDSLTIKKYVP